MYRFTIIDYTTNPLGDSTVIPEPLNADNLELVIQRDEKLSGIFFHPESFNDLEFYGESGELLYNAYITNGIKAKANLLIEYKCEDDGDFVEIAELKFDFGEFRKICDDICIVKIGLEDASCSSILRNRWETKVDLDSLKSLDSSTDNLPNYSALGQLMATNESIIEYKNNWLLKPGTSSNPSLVWDHVDQSGNPLSYYDDYFIGQTFPYINVLTEIDNSSYDPAYVGYTPEPLQPVKFPPLPPNLDYVFNPLIQCTNDVVIDLNFSGGINVTSTASAIVGNVTIRLVHLRPLNISNITLYNVVQNITLYNLPDFTGANTYSHTFTVNASHTLNLQDGDIVNIQYSVFNFSYTSGGGGGSVSTPAHFEMWFDDGGYVNMTLSSSCENTAYNGYLINETLSRVSESITNDCLRVYSDYYGRIDAQPYVSDEDGCGSLRSLTNGLLLRGTESADGSDPQMTISMKDCFDNLYPIDCIGVGMEADPNRAGYDLLRVEPKKYFYQEVMIADLTNAKRTTISVMPIQYIQNLQFGYQYFETERTFGLDDFHSIREYRSTLDNISTAMKIVTQFIASHYAIELTRREVGKSLIDYKYDNNYFILQNRRVTEIDPAVYQEFEYLCETYINGTGTPIIQLADCINFRLPEYRRNMRLSPMRNILRHIREIMKTYLPLTDDFIFTSGTGNYQAEILFNLFALCLYEEYSPLTANALKENGNISLSLLSSLIDGNPYEKNEEIDFEIPMTFNEYLTIKANPYGYIKYTCNEQESKGWIKEIKYSLMQGMATVKLTSANL